MNISLLTLLLACGSADEAPTTTPTAGPTPTSPDATPEAAEPADCASKLATYDGQFKSDPLLSETDAAEIAAKDLRVTRNEIFARYGRAFKSEDLQKHFGAQSWYCVNDDFKDDMLSSNDTKNVKLLKDMEGDNGDKILQVGQFLNPVGYGVLLTSKEWLDVVDTEGGDMYAFEPQQRHWESRGNYLVTWEGGATYEPGKAQSVMLWKLDIEQTAVLDYWSL
jgi:hypothetical protein